MKPKTASTTASFVARNNVRIPGLNLQVSPALQQRALQYVSTTYPQARALLARAHRLTTGEQAELQALLIDVFMQMRDASQEV